MTMVFQSSMGTGNCMVPAMCADECNLRLEVSKFPEACLSSYMACVCVVIPWQ
jgi:hypothetical protein